MTELETILAMFDRAGVEYDVTLDSVRNTYVKTDDRRTGMSAANLGYLGFFTELTFDQDGLLKSVGSWE